jgi:exocyst complex component 6
MIFIFQNDREKFEIYYRKQRRDQIQLIVERQIAQQKMDSIDGFIPYLNEIIGFFVIEDRIAQMQSSLVTETHKEELWELALLKITEAINSHFGKCTNVDLIFSMKKLLLLFALTTKSYGYNPVAFYNLLQNFRYSFLEINLK